MSLVDAQDRLRWEAQGCRYCYSGMQTLQVLENAKSFQHMASGFLYASSYTLWQQKDHASWTWQTSSVLALCQSPLFPMHGIGKQCRL